MSAGMPSSGFTGPLKSKPKHKVRRKEITNATTRRSGSLLGRTAVSFWPIATARSAKVAQVTKPHKARRLPFQRIWALFDHPTSRQGWRPDLSFFHSPVLAPLGEGYGTEFLRRWKTRRARNKPTRARRRLLGEKPRINQGILFIEYVACCILAQKKLN